MTKMPRRFSPSTPTSALCYQGAHLLQLGSRRHLDGGRVFAEHRVANRGVLRQHRDVRLGFLALEHVEVLREALEVPARAGEQRVDVHALHHREVAQQRLAQRRRTRRDAEAAVAHHRGGDAERHRGRERRVPGDLRVVVRVHVDDSRHQREAAGVDGASRRLVAFPDDRDVAVPYPDVSRERFTTAAVVNAGIANQDVEHRRSLSHNERNVQYRGGT
jgi:hypothetical protein